MEYVFYISAVLVIGLICLLAIRGRFKVQRVQVPRKFAFLRRPPAVGLPEPGAVEPGLHSDVASGPSWNEIKPALDRALLHVRTPWGWPRHEERNRVEESRPSLSARLQLLADRLLREKSLVGDPSSDPRVSASIRALMEDRYGRAHRQSMSEIEYQKVKAPRLRDPSAPHDQMDNFGTKEAERIRQKLKTVKAMNAAPAAAEDTTELRYVDLKDIKRPWGW